MCLQIKQLRIDVPAGTIQPIHQLLVRDAHSAAESVLPSSACAVIYGVMPHVHISNTPSSTNVIVELDGLLQASKQLLIPPKDTCCTVADNDCRSHIFIRLSLSDFRDSLTISIGHSYSTPGLLVWLNDSYRHENGVYPFRDDRSHLTTLASVPGPLSRHV